jgi:hypothetical protein
LQNGQRRLEPSRDSIATPRKILQGAREHSGGEFQWQHYSAITSTHGSGRFVGPAQPSSFLIVNAATGQWIKLNDPAWWALSHALACTCRSGVMWGGTCCNYLTFVQIPDGTDHRTVRASPGVHQMTSPPKVLFWFRYGALATVGYWPHSRPSDGLFPGALLFRNNYAIAIGMGLAT